MEHPGLDSRTLRRTADCLRALGHPLRLQMLMSLCNRECNVGQIWKKLGISQPLASQHLHRLRRAGLVVTERRGQEICYRTANPELLAWLKQLCGWVQAEKRNRDSRGREKQTNTR